MRLREQAAGATLSSTNMSTQPTTMMTPTIVTKITVAGNGSSRLPFNSATSA